MNRQPPSTFTTLVVSDHTQVIAYCLLFTVVNESYLRLLPVFCLLFNQLRWLGSRVVSVLDSGTEGPCSNHSRDAVLRQTAHTHCAFVHQAAKLVAALKGCGG